MTADTESQQVSPPINQIHVYFQSRKLTRLIDLTDAASQLSIDADNARPKRRKVSHDSIDSEISASAGPPSNARQGTSLGQLRKGGLKRASTSAQDPTNLLSAAKNASPQADTRMTALSEDEGDETVLPTRSATLPATQPRSPAVTKPALSPHSTPRTVSRSAIVIIPSPPKVLSSAPKPNTTSITASASVPRDSVGNKVSSADVSSADNASAASDSVSAASDRISPANDNPTAAADSPTAANDKPTAANDDPFAAATPDDDDDDNDDDDDDNASASEPDSIEIEAILSHRKSDPITHRNLNLGKEPITLYQVKWVGFDKPTWEPRESFDDDGVLEEYWARVGRGKQKG